MTDFKWSVAWCHSADQAAANSALQTAGLGPNNFGIETTQDTYDPAETDGGFTGNVTGYSIWGLFNTAERQAAKDGLLAAGFSITQDPASKAVGVINFIDYNTAVHDEIEEHQRVDGFLAELVERRPGVALESYFVVKITAPSGKTYTDISATPRRLNQWDEVTLINMGQSGARAVIQVPTPPGSYEFAGRLDPVDLVSTYTWSIEVNGTTIDQFSRAGRFIGRKAGYMLNAGDLISVEVSSVDTTELTLRQRSAIQLKRITS